MKTLGKLNKRVQLGHHTKKKKKTHSQRSGWVPHEFGTQREKDDRGEAQEEGEKRSAWLKFSLRIALSVRIIINN